MFVISFPIFRRLFSFSKAFWRKRKLSVKLSHLRSALFQSKQYFIDFTVKICEVRSLTFARILQNSHPFLDSREFKVGCTGVFSWFEISWLYFPWKVNSRNYSSPRDPRPKGFPWPIKKLELLTDIRDFTTLLSVILKCKCFEWLESSIKSNATVAC